MRISALFLIVLVAAAFGIGAVERGNRLYRQGKYAEAVEAYRAALRDGKDTPELRYNLGTALVRLGRYQEADEHLRAALASVDPELRQPALYNTGNRYLVPGRGAQNAQEKTQLLDAAVEAYKQALRLRLADQDAKWNLELALREREQQQSSPQAGGAQQQQQQQPPPDQGGAGSAQARARPSPSGGAEQGHGQPRPLTQEQAERILSAAEQDERELYRAKLRKGRSQTPVVRDW